MASHYVGFVLLFQNVTESLKVIKGCNQVLWATVHSSVR